MSYLDLSTSLIQAAKANVQAIWSRVRDNFEAHEDALNVLDTGVTIVPAGTMLFYGAASVPANWLACDGSVLQQADYADLYASIGAAYNTGGEVAGEFRLPDFRGRTPFGSGTGSGLTARAIGDRPGEEEHVLTTAEIAAHAHGITDPGHVHTWPNVAEDGGSGSSSKRISTGLGAQAGVFSTANATGISINNAGAGGGHNNVQPFVCVGFIIKV